MIGYHPTVSSLSNPYLGVNSIDWRRSSMEAPRHSEWNPVGG